MWIFLALLVLKMLKVSHCLWCVVCFLKELLDLKKSKVFLLSQNIEWVWNRCLEIIPLQTEFLGHFLLMSGFLEVQIKTELIKPKKWRWNYYGDEMIVERSKVYCLHSGCSNVPTDSLKFFSDFLLLRSQAFLPRLPSSPSPLFARRHVPPSTPGYPPVLWHPPWEISWRPGSTTGPMRWRDSPRISNRTGLCHPALRSFRITFYISRFVVRLSPSSSTLSPCLYLRCSQAPCTVPGAVPPWSNMKIKELTGWILATGWSDSSTKYIYINSVAQTD